MDIVLTPQNRPDTLSLSKRGESLVVNGDTFDFSDLKDGETIFQSDIGCPFIVEARRADGKLTVVVIAPHGADPDFSAAYPDPIKDAKDGKINLPKVAR